MFSTLCCEDFIRVYGYRVSSLWQGFVGVTAAPGYNPSRSFRVSRRVDTYVTASRTFIERLPSYCYLVGSTNPVIISLSGDEGTSTTYDPDEAAFLAAQQAFFNAGNLNGFIYGTQNNVSQTYTWILDAVRFSPLTYKVETFYETEYNRAERQQEVYNLLFTLDPANEELNFITTYYVNAGTLVFASRGEEPALRGVTLANVSAVTNPQPGTGVSTVSGAHVNSVIQNDYCLFSGVGLGFGQMEIQCIKRFDNPVRCNMTIAISPSQLQLSGPDYSVGLFATTRSGISPACCT